MVSWETSGCWQLSWGGAAKQDLRIALNSFKYHRETRRGGEANEARMCRCAGEQRRAGIGRTAGRAKPMRTKVRKASKGLPVPVRRRSPQPGPMTARRALDHALRQARRRCQQGTHVPMRWRAAPRRLFAESATKKGGRSPPDHFRMKAT